MIKWNEVTWYSRLGAIILFIGVVPVLSFCIGVEYESVLASQEQNKAIVSVSATYPPSIPPLASSTQIHIPVPPESVLSGTNTAPGIPPLQGGVEVKIIGSQAESGTGIFGDAYINGEEVAQDVPVESTLGGTSPGGTYYAYRSLSHASAASSFIAIQIFNLDTGEHIQISSPPGENVSTYVSDSRSRTWYDVMPYIESYAWENDHSINFVFYYFAWSATERVSPREIWNYDLNTKQYTLISTEQ